MRKTFAYQAYQSGIDITLIQKLLNHSAPSVTLAYIGITQDQMYDVYLNLNL
jgi:site-specific recombinase XerD